MRAMLTEVTSSGVHPLRRWRKERKLTLQYIGDACGRSAAAISRYETGVDMPPYSVAAQIAALTDGEVRVADFYPEPARSGSDGAASPAPGGAGDPVASDARPAAPRRGSAGRPLAVTSAAGRKAALASRDKRRRLAGAGA